MRRIERFVRLWVAMGAFWACVAVFGAGTSDWSGGSGGVGPWGGAGGRAPVWAPGRAAAADPALRDHALQLFDSSPAVFVPNEGQFQAESVRFVHRGNGANVLLSDDGIVFQLFQREEQPSPRGRGDGGEEGVRTFTFRAYFPGARAVCPEGEGRSGASFNYYRGNDPGLWRSDVAGYEKVVYRGLYPGIDLVVYGKRSHLKYEFHVWPGADPEQIRVAYDWIYGLSVDGEGRLRVQTPMGDVVEEKPYIYQGGGSYAGVDGDEEVCGEFRLVDDFTYTIALTSGYDPTRPLVIDPDLAWATYLGGSDNDTGWGIAVDGAGGVYVTGDTESSDFPTRNGWDTSFNGGEYDAFVAKFDSSGTLLWATYLGGTDFDWGRGIAVDGSGGVYVTGETQSSDFPTPGGWDTTPTGEENGFVAKFNSSGTLLWATYLGGSDEDWGNGIAVDGSGGVYVAGCTDSTDFPTPNGWDTSLSGGQDAFVAKFDSSGTLLWGTYLGGSTNDLGYGIAVDGSGGVYVTGYTYSPNFPTPGGSDTSFNGKCDGFVAKLDSSGTLLWATYVGGSYYDEAYGIAVDGSGGVYVGGRTRSFDLPAPGGWDTSLSGGADGFVAKFDSSGTLLWATYLGGSGGELVSGIAADGSGGVYVTGYTFSTDFPTPGGWDTSYNSTGDAFVAKLDSSGTLLWASYLGGATTDRGYGIAVDGSGGIYVTGEIYATEPPTPGGLNVLDPEFLEGIGYALTPGGLDGEDSPTKEAEDVGDDFPTPGGWDTSPNGYIDAFVAKFLDGSVVGPDISCAWKTLKLDCKKHGPRQTCSGAGKLTVKNDGNAAAKNVRVKFYLSDNAKVDAADVLAGTELIKYVAAGKSVTIAVRLKFKKGVTISGKYLIVVAEVANDTDPRNNFLALPINYQLSGTSSIR